MKTLEIIKHEKRVAEAKRPLDDKLVLSIRDELTPSGIQMILNTDRFSNNKVQVQYTIIIICLSIR